MISPLVTDRISNALRRAYEDKRHATKLVARDIGGDPRAVRAWMAAECAPSAAALIELMSMCDELDREVGLMVAEARERRKK